MSKIKFLVMDVDGTLTDGKIYMGQNGEIAKAFDIKDGCGIYLKLPRLDISPVIITARESTIVENRCKELAISELYQNSKDKLKTLNEVMEKYNSDLSSVAYVGDDLPDIPCMEAVKEAGGIVLCPYDAIPEIRALADYISACRAGDGAVRDCINYLSQNSQDNLKERIDKVVSMVLAGEYDDVPKGVLADGTSYTIQEYVTKDEEDCIIESHRNHIDVQYMISGYEKINLYGKKWSLESGHYNDVLDVDTWDNASFQSECIMTKGSLVVIYNNQPHKGAVSVKNNCNVKKLVCKILV